MTLKHLELLDLPLRDLLDLFRRCEELAAVIERGRKTVGKYGTTEAMIRQSNELVAEVRRLQARVARREAHDE